MTYAQRDAGYYTVGGQRYISITRLLEPIGCDYPDDRGTFYMDRGTLTHEAVQAFLEGRMMPDDAEGWLEYEVMRNDYDIDLAEVIPGVRHGVEWCRRYVRSVARIEVPGVNLACNYAGKPDWYGAEIVGYDGLAVIDCKRQASKTPERKYLAQVAAQYHLEYVALHSGPGERYGDMAAIKHFGNLCITDDGAYLRTYTPQQVERAFQCAVASLALEHSAAHYTDGWCDMSRAYIEAGIRRGKEKRAEWLTEGRRKQSDPGYIGWGPCYPERVEKPKPQPRRRVTAAERRVAAGAALWYGDRAEV